MSNEVLVYEAIQALRFYSDTEEATVDAIDKLANALYDLVIILCAGNAINTRELNLYHDWLKETS